MTLSQMWNKLKMASYSDWKRRVLIIETNGLDKRVEDVLKCDDTQIFVKMASYSDKVHILWIED